MRKLASLILLILLSGCFFQQGWKGPRPEMMDMRAYKNATPEYELGWEHGCESGLATYATFVFKSYYSFYQDYNMLSDRHYNAAWHEAFNFCRHYSLKYYTHEVQKD